MSIRTCTGEGGKGDKRRPQQVGDKEMVLRWELAFCKCPERRKEILKELEGLLK